MSKIEKPIHWYVINDYVTLLVCRIINIGDVLFEQHITIYERTIGLQRKIYINTKTKAIEKEKK